MHIYKGALGQEYPLGEGTGNPPVFLPGELHGQKSLASYSPWGFKGSDMTEATWCVWVTYICIYIYIHLHTHTYTHTYEHTYIHIHYMYINVHIYIYTHIYWWATVHGITKSLTRLSNHVHTEALCCNYTSMK